MNIEEEYIRLIFGLKLKQIRTEKNQNAILLLSVFISLSLVTLVHLQPNIGHQERAQSVRSSQDRNCHRNQVWSLATILHLVPPFCPSRRLLLTLKWQPGKIQLTTDVITHNVRFIRASPCRTPQSCICVLSLASVYLWSNEFVNQLPIGSIFSQQSFIPTLYW